MKPIYKNTLLGFLFLLIIPQGVAAESTNADHTIKVLSCYMTAFNAKDWKAFHSTHHSPYFQIDSEGRMTVLDNNRSSQPTFLFPTMNQADWSHAEWDFHNIIQNLGNNIHVRTRFSVYQKNGYKLESHDATYIINKQNEKWGIAGMSIIQSRRYVLRKKEIHMNRIMYVLEAMFKSPL